MLPEKTRSASNPLGRLKTQDVELQFNHVSNWEYSRIAIDDYLASKGFPKQLHVAEVILFMERSFKGKYLQKERSHFQFVTPPKQFTPSRRKGDSLSEKIPFCKHKDSFNKKFSIVGHTEVIRQNHFNERDLNFEGKMYLRMIDTNDGNVSWFYRNDEIAHKFIQDALRFKADYMERSGKTIWSGGSELYGVVGVDYMESLLDTNTLQEYPKKTLIAKPKKERKTFYFSVEKTDVIDTTNFEGNCKIMNQTTPTKKLPKSAGKGKTPFTSVDAMKFATTEMKAFSDYFVKAKAYSDPVINGTGLYKIWKDAVASNDLGSLFEKDISKTSKDYISIEKAFETFTQGYPAEEFPIFMDTIMREWSSVKKYLVSVGWDEKKLGPFPDIGFLRYNLPKLDIWYKEYKKDQQLRDDIANQKAALKAQELQKATTIPPNSSLQNGEPIVQYAKVVNKFEKSSVGYTYISHGHRYNPNGTENRTYEQDYVDARQEGDLYKANMIMEVLDKKSLNIDESKKRIASLLCS